MIRCKHPQNLAQPSSKPITFLSESGWSLRAEQLLGAGLGDAVGERELQVLGNQLLDVGALDVGGLLDLNNTEDLGKLSIIKERHIYQNCFRHTWMDLKRARWRAAMSEYRDSTASVLVSSLYSLYML